MKTTDYIAFTIDRLPKGYVFTYSDFITEEHKAQAIIKALNRMAGVGKIAKLSKGRFYKPKQTVFGELQPSEEQVVKDLLEEDGKPIGYLTGYSIYNKMALTTQVSNVIQIGRNQIRPKLKRGKYIISFIKQKNTITKENIPHLQLLDALRYIKKIPDASIEFLCKRFIVILKDYKQNEREVLMRLAKKYPPSTRALLGALLDELEYEGETGTLFETLNPITTYRLSEAEKVLATTKKWNIR